MPVPILQFIDYLIIKQFSIAQNVRIRTTCVRFYLPPDRWHRSGEIFLRQPLVGENCA